MFTIGLKRILFIYKWLCHVFNIEWEDFLKIVFIVVNWTKQIPFVINVIEFDIRWISCLQEISSIRGDLKSFVWIRSLKCLSSQDSQEFYSHARSINFQWETIDLIASKKTGILQAHMINTLFHCLYSEMVNFHF